MATIIINGQPLEIGDQERLNGIQAARRAGIEIPHYCWHAGLSVVASCRMCLVETGTRNAETGQISMLPKLVPACQTPARDGTVFVTNSENVRKARAMVEEDLLIDHPIDCPICDKAGECLLQDYHFEHGQESRRADLRPFTSRRRDVGPTVTLFVDRCVMCSRCVRFCREVTGTNELMVINRGAAEEIDTVPGYPLANKMSGNVVDLCPVGALGDKDFLYSQRVWFMKRHVGICTGCSTGCNMFTEENQDTVYRLKPRENPLVNQWWLCDEGRYGYHHVHSPERLVEPKRCDAESGNYVNAQWSGLVDELPAKLSEAGRLAAVISPHLTVEEAYLLIRFIRGIDPEAVLAMGPVPVVGVDEKFPTGFTIHAEKCPNRRGVQMLLQHFAGQVLAWEDFLKQVDDGQFGGVWISGGYKTEWNDEATAARFDCVNTLVVQDMFRSPLYDQATYQLPGASFAEREGCYVNHADRIQFAEWAVRPPVGVWVEGQLYWRLLEKSGLFKARQALDEAAAEVVAFHEAGNVIPPTGLDLKLNQMAAAT